MPVCEKGWPQFANAAELDATDWGPYFAELYGQVPANQFPLKTADFWMLYDGLLKKHAVPLPPSAGNCAPADCSLNLFVENNAYSPPSQWIWHPPPPNAAHNGYLPYADFAANTWVEVMHEADPFGDEHNGAWYVYAKGSGVWYNIGKSITFTEHDNAFQHFSPDPHNWNNEAMCRIAAAQGYDTIQFSAHRDGTNYPCAGQGHYPYMNIEIVAVKLVGTYACGSKAKPDFNVLRSGWASQPCDCDNGYKWANCGHQYALGQTLSRGAEGAGMLNYTRRSSQLSAVPADCSSERPHEPPFWWSACLNSTGCIRVTVSSSIPTLSLRNLTTFSDHRYMHAAGYDWCIDHLNAITYARITGVPRSSITYFEVADHTTGRLCRFLNHHWIDGDHISVYNESGLSCVLDWVQLPGPDGATNATLTVTSGGPPPGPKPGCPGGSLVACMSLCPSAPPAAYQACVQVCDARCL
jgi:hypothetical protein